MTDMTETAGAPSETNEAPTPEATAPAQGTQPTPDEATTLRSRNAGLDAKVTSLMESERAAIAAKEAAEKKLRDYEAGTVQADEALRAQLSEAATELAQARKDAALARIASQFPETFSVLGESAATLTADQLAASEARFAGVPAETSTPVPVGNNAPREPKSGKSEEDMTAAELRAFMEQQFRGRDAQGNPY